MKDDTISRQAAIDAIDRLDIPEDMCVFEILSHIELEIGNLPSAQPKRKTGRWINSYKRQTCSICKQRGYRSWNFCPNCGADMRGEQDG